MGIHMDSPILINPILVINKTISVFTNVSILSLRINLLDMYVERNFSY